jgi:hypothetical protein
MPLKALPTEILNLIFEEYIRINGSIITLLSVSKVWRGAVERMPTLWHRIHLCVDDIPSSWRNGSIPYPSTLEGLQTILKRTGTHGGFKVALVLGDARLPEPLPQPSRHRPLPRVPTLVSNSMNEARFQTDRRARLFGGLRFLDLPDGTKPIDRVRSLRIEINPSVDHEIIKASLDDLANHRESPLVMPVLQRLKISIAPRLPELFITQICAALSSLLHALNVGAPSLNTLCLERPSMGLLTRVLSPFPFYGSLPSGIAGRLRRINIKNSFQVLDISAFAFAESLEDLSFSGTLTYNPMAPAITLLDPLPDTAPMSDETWNNIWRTLYPELQVSPNFTPSRNVLSVYIPNLTRLCIGTISMPTLRRLQFPMLEKLTILHMDEDNNDIPLPKHSLVLRELRELDIGTYRHEVDAIVAPNLEYFKLGIPDTTSGIIDEESDWCTRGCNIREDGTFIHNCDGTNRASRANIPGPPLLNRVFDGDDAMLQPRVLHISGPVHDHVLVDALRNLPELSSLTLSYRVAIEDKFWRSMTPRADLLPTDSTRPASTQDAEALLCPKLESLTLDLCTKSPNTPESDLLGKRLREMIDARNRYAGIAPLGQVTVQWEPPAKSWDVLAMGSPQ